MRCHANALLVAGLITGVLTTASWGKTSLGISAGPAFVDLQGRESLEPRKFEAGLHVRSQINSMLAWRSGLIVRTLGPYVQSGFDENRFYRTTYLSVPLEMEIHPAARRSVQPIGSFGLAADFLVRAKIRYLYHTDEDNDAFDEMSKTYWSLVGSAGARLPGPRLDLRVRASHSMSSIGRDYWTSEMEHRSVAFEMTWWLPV